MAPARQGDAVFTAYAKSQIGFHARRLSRMPGSACSEEEDFAQDLATFLWAKARLYELERGRYDTFVDRVLRTAAITILRDRYRLKRAVPTSTLSLDTESKSGAGEVPTALRNQISGADAVRRLGGVVEEARVHQELEMDVHQLLSRLPAIEQEIARRLMDGQSEACIAADPELSRGQVPDVVEKLRGLFSAQGFDSSEFRGHRRRKRRK